MVKINGEYVDVSGKTVSEYHWLHWPAAYSVCCGLSLKQWPSAVEQLPASGLSR